MSRRHIMAVGLALSAASALTWGAERGPLPRGLARQVARTDGNAFIGILGAVGQPGVYETADNSPTLLEVLNRAGGLAPDATGSVRIIRDGKSGQQVFFMAATSYRLLPGDVVSVVGRTSRTSAIRMAGATGENVQTPDAPSEVRLAFVNLLDRPVVLRVDAGNANIERLVELLQQPPELAKHVQVIAPSAGSRGPWTPTSTLPSGAVLVFDRTKLDSSRIPGTLPPAYGLDRASDSPSTGAMGSQATPSAPAVALPFRSTVISGPAEESRSGASPGPILMTAAPTDADRPSRVSHPAGGSAERRETPSVPQVAQSQSVEFLPPSPAANEPPVDVLPPSSDARSALRSPSAAEAGAGAGRVIVGDSDPVGGNNGIPGESSPIRSKPGRNIASSAPMDGSGPSAKAASALVAMGKANDDVTKRLSAELASFSGNAEESGKGATNLEIASVWGLFGLLAIVATWMVARRSRTVLVAAPAAAVERVKSRLDKLIANELPLDVESAKLPARVEFYGKARMKPYLRIDASHDVEPRKPYIARAGERAPSEKVMAATDAVSGAPASAATTEAAGHDRRLDEAHGDPRPHTAGGVGGRQPSERKADILERVLTSVQESGPRHVGGPHIGAAPKASEIVPSEGASQL